MPDRRRQYDTASKQSKKDWRGYALPGGHEELGESIVEADEFLNENCYNRKFP